MKALLCMACVLVGIVGVPVGFLLGRKEGGMASVTRMLFLTSQIAALCWVSISYLIAAYATFCLGQVFPVVTLSQQAITTLLGTSALKVVENIFEHNDGAVFGKSIAPNKGESKSDNPPAGMENQADGQEN